MRRSKYNARRTRSGDRTYASRAEARRAIDLQLLQRAGHIQDLEYQVRIGLDVAGHRIGYYVADFVYIENGQKVVEDVKGFKTPMYTWKRKHFAAQYGYEIRETGLKDARCY
jgi:hypothetical protein